MKRMPADSSGSQEMHSFSKRDNSGFLNGANIRSRFSHPRHSRVQPEAEGDLVDEQANEQALLDLMVTIISADRGINGESGPCEQVIESQIVTREEMYRRALVDHVARLKEGERPIGVCVFISSSLSGKYTCPDSPVQMLCRRQAGPVSNVRKLILGKRCEEEGGDGIRMRLGDVFGEEERAARLRWAGESVRIIKSAEMPGFDNARYYARAESPDPCDAEGRNLYVMLKAQDGSMACGRLTPSQPHCELEGDALPDDWDAVFLGLAVD